MHSTSSVLSLPEQRLMSWRHWKIVPSQADNRWVINDISSSHADFLPKVNYLQGRACGFQQSAAWDLHLHSVCPLLLGECDVPHCPLRSEDLTGTAFPQADAPFSGMELKRLQGAQRKLEQWRSHSKAAASGSPWRTFPARCCRGGTKKNLSSGGRPAPLDGIL